MNLQRWSWTIFVVFGVWMASVIAAAMIYGQGVTTRALLTEHGWSGKLLLGFQAASIIVCIVALRKIFSALRRRAGVVLKKSPQHRIDQVREYLADASKLLAELEDDLSTRTRVLEKLQSNAERYEQLASLNKEQAEAIQALISRQLHHHQRANVWQQIVFLLPAFMLGFIVNWLSTPLLQWIATLF